jgi:hypothetical protein
MLSNTLKVKLIFLYIKKVHIIKRNKIDPLEFKEFFLYDRLWRVNEKGL